MTRSCCLTALLLAAVLGGGGCAEALSLGEPFREVSCVERAKISLKDAVDLAEKHGGRAIDSHFHQRDELGCVANKPAHYEITLLRQGKLSFASVNARSGEIEIRQKKPVWEQAWQALGALFESDASEKAQMATSINRRLPDAVMIAERDGGKAMKAHVDKREGKLGYTVKLVERGRLRIAWIDDG